jgi:hypothetical protein
MGMKGDFLVWGRGKGETLDFLSRLSYDIYDA